MTIVTRAVSCASCGRGLWEYQTFQCVKCKRITCYKCGKRSSTHGNICNQCFGQLSPELQAEFAADLKKTMRSAYIGCVFLILAMVWLFSSILLIGSIGAAGVLIGFCVFISLTVFFFKRSGKAVPKQPAPLIDFQSTSTLGELTQKNIIPSETGTVWICKSCGQQNDAAAAHCSGCGKPRVPL